MTWIVGLLIALGALLLYVASNPDHFNQYNHFVWQADAFLHGRAWIPYPVGETANGPANAYLQDVYPLLDAHGNETGRALLPFPPLPAVVLMPFVALFGLWTDQEAISIGLAAIGVALCWWMLGRLAVATGVRALVTVLFAAGTVWWWSAAVGSTWYFAHLVAVDLTLLAVGVALGADPRSVGEVAWQEADPTSQAGARDGPGAADRLIDAVLPLDRAQVLAGLLLGLAVTARLPLLLAAPFFVLVGGGGGWRRRTASAAAGGFLPVAALLLYTWVTTGALVHPGYDYQYQLEANGYPTLGYNPDWAVEDVRYIPQNLGIMFGALPVVLPDVMPDTLGYGPPVLLCTAPDAARGLFDEGCPLAVPSDVGTSLLLTSPAFLFALLPVARRPRARLTLGAATAIVLVAVFNLAHFSQGWVQWGYRFSNDFVPFLLPLVALGVARVDGRPRLAAVVLVGAGIVINAWGVVWGGILGW